MAYTTASVPLGAYDPNRLAGVGLGHWALATALPGVVPLLLIDDPFTVLRAANVLQITLLFLVGHRWAHYSGANPWRTGALVALLGVSLVLVAVALGG